jgi:hypothetical protein
MAFSSVFSLLPWLLLMALRALTRLGISTHPVTDWALVLDDDDWTEWSTYLDMPHVMEQNRAHLNRCYNLNLK